MVTIKKFLKGLGLVIASVIVIGSCVELYLLRGTPGRSLREADLRADTEYSTTPTLLIPGWGGSTVTYDKMINYYQSHHLAQKVLTIWVSPWGSIRVSGHLSKTKRTRWSKFSTIGTIIKHSIHRSNSLLPSWLTCKTIIIFTRSMSSRTPMVELNLCMPIWIHRRCKAS
jgi:Uncharacterized protein with an alpha/beta hydrolase fold